MFNENEIREGLRLRAAPGVPATFAERAAIDFRTFVDQQSSMSAQSALYDEYSDYLKEVERLTGRRLPNPFNQRPERREYMEERIAREVNELRKQYPELEVRTPEQIREKIGLDREEQRKQQADIHSRSIDWPVSVGGAVATMGAAVIDPPVLASMLVGAPAATGILRGALIEGGIGIASEIPVQASVQLGRRQFGEEPSLSEGMMNVAAAGGGGFLFSAALRGLGAMARPVLKGTRDLLERSKGLPERGDLRAAFDYLSRKVELEEASPLGDYPRARAEHAERLSEATRAIMRGEVPDIPLRPREPVRRDVGPESVGVDNEIIDTLGRMARAAADVDARSRAAVVTVSPYLSRGMEGVKELQSQLVGKQERSESLLAFLHKTGGITDEGGELRHMGLTPRVRPGLLRKQGRHLDDATLDAWEAGFLPGESRPEINDLLDAIRSELHGAPVYRMEDAERMMEREAMDETLEALIDAGVDPRRLKPTEFGKALRDMSEAIIAKDASAQIHAARMGTAAKAADEAEQSVKAQDALDAFTEQEVRRLYEGQEDTEILFQTESGLERQTVRDLYDDLAGDMEDYDALTVCTGRPI